MPDDTKRSTTTTAATQQVWEATNWADLQNLYHLAAEAEPGERTRILRAATEDADLVARVLDLLNTEVEAELAAAAPEPSISAGRVGPYKLMRLIGTGGLGAVYLAQRVLGGAVQQCAVKVLSLHAAGPAMEARFLREQQIIATLDHAHVTRMLDAGFSDEGQPYLVMEYVQGDTLIESCDAQSMPLRDRIRLFLQVCEAVAYAHRMLIVHLDLKPSNILVSNTGDAKLLDFGTSKLVDPDAALTTTVLATPAYASPEQLRGQPVSTACDVYGLGAVLYELLTGARPWGAASAVLIMEHALREHEPPRITETLTDEAAQARGASDGADLRQHLRGDLASIVARCLRSRPADRYTTVDALREDLQRYLDGRPVLTRPQTRRYHAGKFLRRNRLAVTLSASAFMLVLTSLTYAAYRQHQQLAAARRAVQMQQFMTRLFGLAHHTATNKPEATVRDLLRLGARTLPYYVHDDDDLRSARLSIAESMASDEDVADASPLLNDILSQAKRRGDKETALRAELDLGKLYLDADNQTTGLKLLEEAHQQLASTHTTPDVRLSANMWFLYGRSETFHNVPGDLDVLQQEIAKADQLHVDPDELATANNLLGIMEDSRGKLADARKHYERALVLYRDVPESTCKQADTLLYLGHLKREMKDDAAALVDFKRSYDGRLSCGGPDDLSTLSSLAWEANALVMLKRCKEGIDLLLPAMPRYYAATAKHPISLRLPMDTLARAYLGEQKYPEAEAISRKALAMLDGSVAHRSSIWSVAESDLGESLLQEGKFDEAAQVLQSAVNDYPMPPQPSPSKLAYTQRLARYVALARNHQKPPQS